MNTNDKTLADVQPGGRVRLGNVRDRVMGEFEQWFDTTDVDMEAATDSIIAAAQPSPGGQGARAQFEEYRGGDCERDAQGYYVNARTAQDWAMWQAALAARQPGAEYLAELEAAVKRGGMEVCERDDESGPFPLLLVWSSTIKPVSPPARAVDLGAMPDGWRLSKKTTCYQLSHGNEIIGNLVGPDAEANAAIIARVLDSQAVGK